MHPSSSGFALVLNMLLLAYKCETFQNNKLCVFMCVKHLPQTWKLNKWKSVFKIPVNLKQYHHNMNLCIITYNDWNQKGKGESCRV